MEEETSYLDYYTWATSRDTMVVFEDNPEYLVKYPYGNGKYFKVKFKVKKNRIGFYK